MMSRFDAALTALKAETRWEPLPPLDGSVASAVRAVRFALDDLTFSMAAPDDRHLCFTYCLAELAPDEDPQVRAWNYARMAAAAFKTRRTVLSFAGGAFYLSQEVDLTTVDVEQTPLFCQNFLNDCDWWRENSSSGL
jgi:hypothetical protein